MKNKYISQKGVQMKIKIMFGAGVLLASSILVGSAIPSNPKEIVNQTQNITKSIIADITQTQKLYDEKKALFLDARPFKLYQAGTIPGALSMDYKEYNALKHLLPADKNVLIVTFCNGYKCEHSDHLIDLLQKDGYKNILNYKGGYPEWKEHKKPQMGLLKECKETSGAYIPTTPLLEIKGAKVHTIKGDNAMIDQFWFSQVVLADLPKNIQLIDVRKAEDFKTGHLKGAINVPTKDGQLDISKLPKDKLNVFYCNTGMQSTETALWAIKNNQGRSIMYFDATINCKGDQCTVEPNELLE